MDRIDDVAEQQTEQSENTVSNLYDINQKYSGIPLIVIAGRPNTGKSTLFNRFLHRRRAITDPTPGVTRDPICEQAFINGLPVQLMDTGGFKLDRETGTMEAVMDELVVQKTLESLKQADRILLMLFQDLLCISAEHGDHIDDLARQLTNGLDFSQVQVLSKEKLPIRIAIVGKPNTGKSTLSNRLTHSQASIVSDYAGTTRDVVEGSFSYKNQSFTLLDTAGIRRKAKVKENIEYYSVTRAIKSLDRCDIVFLLIDIQEGLAEQDKKLAQLASERGRGVIFVLNKWDTQEEQTKKAFRDTEKNIKIMFGHMGFAPITAISAQNGSGIKQLLDIALQLYSQLTKKTDTGILNTALSDWLSAYPPPASRANHFKIKYMVQTSVNPVSFLLFATRPEAVPDTYLAYLRNRIRQDLGYENIPIQLNIRASRKKWEDRDQT